MMDRLLTDLRHGLRALAKSPAFTAVALAALALGIGANTAVFSVINAVLLRPLPFANADRLVMLWEDDTHEGNPQNPLAPANLVDFREHNRSFEELAYYSQPSGTNLTGAGEPERLQAAAASANIFALLGVEPALGRSFTARDEAAEAEPPVLISHGLWQRRFGGDRDVLGKKLLFDGDVFTVVGVLPRGFKLHEDVDVWIVMGLDPQRASNRSSHYLRAVGRLKPGVTIEQARADLSGIAGELERRHPDTNAGRGATLLSLEDQLTGDVRRALLVLLGAVGFVLLIACANIANLLLARGAARQKEIAVRVALGASRMQLVRQLLTESLMLSVIGGALGLLLALWGMDLLASLGPGSIHRIEDVGLDLRVLGFTIAVSLVTGVAFGLLPALQFSRTDLNESLKESSKGGPSGAATGRARNTLMVAEVALSLVLLAGAGLMIKSFMRIHSIDPGFNPENVLTLQVALPASKYREPFQRIGFFQQAMERLAVLPGVEAAGAISRLPLAGDRSTAGMVIEGRPERPGENPEVHFRAVAGDYFGAMQIPFVAGRDFTERDRLGAPPVLVVNEAAARQFWPGEDPLGKRVRLGPNPRSPWTTIVGVVKSARNFGLDAELKPEVYASYLQNGPNRMRLLVRTAGDPATAVAAVRGEIQAIDADMPISQVATMESLLAGSVAERRLYMLLLGTFAAIALLLAAVGIYGVVAYSVAQRTREIGIRMALGAQSRDVLRMVIGRGMLMVLIGIALGSGAALVMTRLAASLLYEVSATDPATFILMALGLATVSLLACYVPARRATRVDPMVALRAE
jgi:putative ABC transport system permease protein